MPIPDIVTLLSTTTPTITAMVDWLTPLFVLVLGLAVAGVGLAVIYSGLVGGLSRLFTRKED